MIINLPHDPKILEMTPERKKEIVDKYCSLRPEELASYYVLMGHSERTFIYNEVLPLKQGEGNYCERFWFLIEHPLELRDKLAGVEKKTQETR